MSADADIGQAIDLFLEREAAEAMLTDWFADKPDWADALCVGRGARRPVVA